MKFFDMLNKIKKGFALLFFLMTNLIFSCKTTAIQNNSIEKEVNYIPYYLKVYEADSLYIVKNYQKSHKILDSLFKKHEPINMSIYYELCTYYKTRIILNKNINTNNFSKLITKYGLTEDMIRNDSILNIFYQENKPFFIKNYTDLRSQNISTININLRNEIKEMSIKDQSYRQSDFEKQNKIDSINSIKISHIFKNFGYPNEFVIGNSSVDHTYIGIEAILLHTADNDRINYFMPKVFEFIKKGKASPKMYANLKDQMELYHDKEQYYGSYENKTSISVNELNKRRKEIGLPNYGYEKWRLKKLYLNQVF